MTDWLPKAIEATRNAGDFVFNKLFGPKGDGKDKPPPKLSQVEDVKQQEQDAATRKTPSNDTANLPLTIFNILNFLTTPMIAGSPIAIYHAGPYLGGPTFAVILIAIWISMNLLTRTAKELNLSNYQDIAQSLQGKKGFAVVTFFEFCYYEGVLTILMLHMTMNTTHAITHISAADWGEAEDIFLYVHVFVTVIIIWPSSLFLNPLRLAKLSLLCLIFFLITCILFTYLIFSFDTSEYNYGYILPSWDWRPPASGECIATIISGILIHNCNLMMHEALKNNTMKRWNIAFASSLLIYLCILTTFAYAGYLSFFEYTQGNILENFCINDQYAVPIRILTAITIALFYPIILRLNLQVIQNCSKKELKKKQNILIITAFVALSAILSALTKCVAVLRGFHGSLFASAILFIIPSYFYIRAFAYEDLTLIKLSAIIVFCSGIFISLYCTVEVSLNIEQTIFLCAEGKEPYYCYDIKPPEKGKKI